MSYVINNKKTDGYKKMNPITLIINTRMTSLVNSNHTLKDIFTIIHQDEANIFSEETIGYHVKKTTYGECKSACFKMGSYLLNKLKVYPKNTYVGLMMENSVKWIETFWGLLMAGYQPMLLNIRLGMPLVNEIIKMMHIEVCLCDKDYEVNSNKIIIDNNLVLEEWIKEENYPWANQIALSTSATSLNLKICVYDGNNIAEQIMNSKKITETNRMIREHYDGSLKQLTFLPFYHVFGLMATYFWFAFFGRTFVFLQDYSGETILKTVKKHHVTHIFAVPMLWQTIYQGAIKAINNRGEKTVKHFNRALDFSNKLQSVFPYFGRFIARKMFKEVHQQIMGDSIKFMISGGSYLAKPVLEFFNGIGYPLFNGYGMSEIGITSVELRKRANKRNLASIGKPFNSVTYKINQDGCLLVKGNSICKMIITKEKKLITNSDWFNTHDLAKERKGSYYLIGRQDDIVLTPNGEKINPDLLEQELNLEEVKRYVVMGLTIDDINYLSLIVEINPSLDQRRLRHLITSLDENIQRLDNLHYHFDKVFITYQNIASEMAIKVSRTVLIKWIENGQVKLIPYQELKKQKETDIDEIKEEVSLKVRMIIAQILERKPEEITYDDHFIFDLGGTSLQYLSLLVKLKEYYDQEFIFLKDDYCYTVRQFCQYILKNEKGA